MRGKKNRGKKFWVFRKVHWGPFLSEFKAFIWNLKSLVWEQEFKVDLDLFDLKMIIWITNLKKNTENDEIVEKTKVK